MADYGYPKSKSSRRVCDEDLKSKVRKRRREECKETKSRSDCKTPPLDELIKQRESLKEELNKITKEKKSEGSIMPNNLKNSNRNLCDTNIDNQKINTIISNETQHEEDYSHLDSEDEENIIEQRRKQRKQLLEKLNLHAESNSNVCTSKTEVHKEVNSNQPESRNSNSPVKLELSKEATDMFSEKEFIPNEVPDPVTQDSSNTQLLSDNWDDSEGYYNVRVGDIIDNNKYVVKSILGQGVFANVILAQDIKSNNSDVAVKIMRNNDLIYKTGLKELAILREINDADPDNKYHCVRLLKNFMHKGHLCLVLEPLYMDLRHVIKKYGRHGLNMKAVMSYSRQLLLALRLMKKIGIIHADVKPDNILVNEKKNVLKLCDFGSASKIGENEPTPYLVSRFYRAPEIILGIPFKHSVDVWSTACTMYEMATGKIMFTGSSNNKMLKCFMDMKGRIPGKMIRKGRFKDQHFNYNNNFLLHKKDVSTGREKFIELVNINPTRDLLLELRKTHKNLSQDDDNKLLQLKDILDKMLALDYHQRLSVTDCLKHPFIQEPLKK